MTMDDATSLVSELTTKLSELEQKVQHHRQDMAAEYERYSRQLLKNQSEELLAKVNKAIQDSMHHYPALGPALSDKMSSVNHNDSRKSHSPESNHDKPGASNDRGRRGRGSPPPILPHTSGTPPEDGSRSPHEREKEFQGLFTPSYLPLLGGGDRHRRDDDSLPLAAPSALPSSPVQDGELRRDSVKAEKKSPASNLSVAILPRPEPTRRNTGETLSSITSDDSTYRTRRSALRRSSSASAKIQSPRHVRFEVEGGEVLPTASPPMSPRFHDHPASPLAKSSNIMNVSFDPAAIDDEDETGGLLGSSPPRPKKITSTDKLKALTRNSTEDTSLWTVVGNLQGLDEDDDVLMMGQTSSPGVSARNDENTRQHVNNVEDKHDADLDEDDEDLQELPALSSFKARKRFSPPRSAANRVGSSKTSNLTANNEVNHSAETSEIIPKSSRSNEEEEDFFDYEPDEDEEAPTKEETAIHDSKASQKYLEEEEDEIEEEAAEDPTSQSPTDIGLYSTSAAIPIGKDTQVESPTLPSRYNTASIGSYKGQPYTMSSITNRDVHDSMAKLGDIHSFIGSVNDRLGVDPSTSFRAETVPFVGSPKSFSQRMMMEDYQEARKNAAKFESSR